MKLPKPLANLGRTQSDLVREAPEQQKQGAGESGPKSCAELMAALDGFFEGPPDLSSNRKYLKDFGK